MEEQLTAINERQDAMMTQMESLCSSVHQHAELFETVQKSLVAQQSVMTDLMVKLTRLERPDPAALLLPSSVPPLLPRPPITTTTPQQSNVPAILPDQRIEIAAFYMTGDALQWYHWLYCTQQLSTWEVFSRQAELRFGPPTFVNHEAQLFKVKQQTTLAAYLSEFESLSTRVRGLSSTSLLNCFLSGLREDIQTELYVLKPASIHDAMGMAKLVDDKHKAMRAFQPPRFLPTRSPQLQNPTGVAPTLNRTSAPGVFPIKRLTPAEMASRREHGLCFNCDSKFIKGHRCAPSQFLCLMTEDSDEPVSETEKQDHPILATEPEPPDAVAEEATNPCISFHALNGLTIPSTLKITGKIHGKDVVVLIDGGSTNNFIQTRWAHHLNLPIQQSSHLRVTVGNGEVLTCGGECQRVPLQLGEVVFPVDLLLLPVFCAGIVLGVHWLAELGPIVFDYQHLWMEFQSGGATVRLHGVQQPCIQDTSHTSLKRHVHSSTAHQFFYLSVSLTTPEHNQPPSITTTSNTAPSQFTDQLQQLLLRYDDIFCLPVGLPPARAFDHKIPLLLEAAPVNVRPYRYTHFQKAEIEHLVDNMLKEGGILVKKKDGSWRFCVDYRALNAITIKDRFSIPTVEELLDELSSAHIFSKLNLRSGYHQVRIHPPDIEKTAFRMHEGHYEFLVMSFGLSNAPSSFQAMMHTLFRSALRKYALVFFDDILIYSRDWVTHLEHLHHIFALFRDHKIFAKRSKCEFGCSSIGYLGHRINGQGVQVDPEKIQAIQHWPHPTTLRCLRGFLGISGYYRRFVRGYAAISAPLTELLCKNLFVWTPEATKAYEALKFALTQTPILQLPDFSCQFEVHTDAWSTGIGAVLLRKESPYRVF
ncbi:uncharacterized protein LOC120263108 [Dioscorea cayenensis subsp. rotundata]|uniref:Uncharacterized protein LOC120263108 n=1 Tax=Dioscorea cayennensis subsp. rotundata TaxID=55577 RepID=A0AB40BHZ0_DIOCR|nr:uncharacterized protein LOC120263108 [Dioscorea cayenensis subsp. rotundata]